MKVTDVYYDLIKSFKINFWTPFDGFVDLLYAVYLPIQKNQVDHEISAIEFLKVVPTSLPVDNLTVLFWNKNGSYSHFIGYLWIDEYFEGKHNFTDISWSPHIFVHLSFITLSNSLIT